MIWMKDIIPLDEVVYDARARDGTWCTLPYPDHPKGCPNYPKCISYFRDFRSFQDHRWFAIIEEFDLTTHAEKMKEKHPSWSERQCRNLLYWQNGVRKRLRDKAHNFRQLGDVLLEIPEACGVNVYETMNKVGVAIQRNKPNLIIKVMLVGKPPSMGTSIIETKKRTD